MSDEHLYQGQSQMIRMRVWVLGQMVWGAFLAGAVLAGIGAVLLVVWGISLLLPEQSKQMPSVYGQVEQAQQVILT